MMKTEKLITEAYRAFNDRDIDGALALMTMDVNWPKASEGGRAIGKGEIRAYWTRQWKEFNPHVEPIEMIEQKDGSVSVKVHQLVKNLEGDVLSDIEVWHVFAFVDGLIDRMDILELEGSSDSSPSEAFAKQ